MKKIISVLLTVLMIFSMAVPAFAAEKFDPESSRSQIPVIRILGDGEPLYDADGNKIFHLRTDFTDIGGDEEEDDNSNLVQSLANVLLPFLINGLLNDDWDPYFENLQKEIGELTGDAKLDGNGNPVPGTGISKERQEFLNYASTHDKKGKKGYYGLYDYHFWYDWRLDPIESAAKLNDYIKAVKNITGAEKVGINASCLGTIVTTAYVSQYGVDDIQGIGYTGSLAFGAEFLSEAISGKFDINSGSLNRVLMDSAYLGLFNFNDFVDATVDLVVAAGVVDFLEADIRKNIYDKLVYGVTSALALSTIFTYPSYWAAVSKEDYAQAMLHVFGPEGSEKRKEYAGLITKIETYNTEVRAKLPAILSSIKDGGANFGAIAKYGFQILPICESYDAVSDQFVSVNHASFGATTSTIYDTLSDDHIAARVAENKGKYISPDKQIDASTCIFPNYTWFVKNSSHSEYTEYEKKILYDVATADRQLTVDDFEWSQFMVYDYDTDTMAKMTEDNCHTEQWEADKGADDRTDEPKTLIKFLTALLNWIAQLFKFLKK